MNRIQWRMELEEILDRKWGISPDEVGDWPEEDCFSDGMTPKEAAEIFEDYNDGYLGAPFLEEKRGAKIIRKNRRTTT
jgi:hypothetical protein